MRWDMDSYTNFIFKYWTICVYWCAGRESRPDIVSDVLWSQGRRWFGSRFNKITQGGIHLYECLYPGRCQRNCKPINSCNPKIRVNFRGVITPVLGFFDVLTLFLREWGVALRLKIEVRRVAVCAVVKNVARNNRWYGIKGMFSAFRCLYESVCGVSRHMNREISICTLPLRLWVSPGTGSATPDFGQAGVTLRLFSPC